MKNQIIIHAAGKQTRIALLENNELTQLFIESPENQRTVGDIYVAEVRKVMSGIRAAFIDMNTPKDAFLHFSDLGEHLDDYLVMLNGKEVLTKDAASRLSEIRAAKDPNQTNKSNTNTEEQNVLGNMLKPGQRVLVQIVKEPIGSKGPRVSTNISIAGRFLVLIPMGDYVAVSKRIKSYKERRVLRQTVADLLPDGFGVIVRTVAEGVDSNLIEEDLKDVLEKWNNIVKDVHSAKPPTLLHRDLEMTESLVRDLFAKDFDRILVDDAKMHKTLRSYVQKIAPNLLSNIELYKGNVHIFDHMRIMQDVESVFSPRVKMPSGGYLIFEQTEAMYVVDVNSGRYAAKKAQEDNSLKTNLEAAREIAKQLRLRDIGGIIVVDFIDLRDDINRKKVYDELKKEFRKDRAKTNLLPMSDFGLVQITRQRIRPSVVKSVSRVCPMCGGGGSIVSQNTLLSDIESWLQKFKLSTSYRQVDLHINPYMRGMLAKGWISQHFKWMLKYRIRIGLIEDQTLSMNDYKFTLSGSDVDITETILMDQSIEQAIKAAEQRIAELESELKRDSTTLDIFVKEKKDDRQGRGSRHSHESRNSRDSGSDRDDRDDRNKRDNRNQRDDRDQQQDRDHRNQRDDRDKRSDRQDSRLTNANESENVRSKETPVESPKVVAKDPKAEARNQAEIARRNQKISKYYKKSDAGADDAFDEQVDAVEHEAPNKKAEPAKEKPGRTAEPAVVKSTGEPTTVADSAKIEDAIPEELSHLRSALEVAREYRVKREKEIAEGQNGGVASEAVATTKKSAGGTESSDEKALKSEVAAGASDANTDQSDEKAQKSDSTRDTTDAADRADEMAQKSDASGNNTDENAQKSDASSTESDVKAQKSAEKYTTPVAKGTKSKSQETDSESADQSDTTSTTESTAGSTSDGSSETDVVDSPSKTAKSEDTDDKKVDPEATSQILQAVMNAKKAPAKTTSKAKTTKKTPAKTAEKKKPVAKKPTKTARKSGDDEIVDDFGTLSDDRPVKGD